MRMRVLLTALALTALLAGPASLAPGAERSAKRDTPVRRSPDLWATVNVCDTTAHPNEIGIRGSMPGLGRRASLSMRFQVQYLAKVDGKWHNIDANADSGFQKVGVASRRVLESGWTFKFLPPPGGGSHMLRGAVTFVWRINGRTVERVREITQAGHRSTTGADPPGFSAATCQIS
jgi:hypothetical protein